MHDTVFARLTVCIAGACGLAALGALQVANTIYQGRGYYSEGTRRMPSTDAANLTLIGALVDNDEAHSTLPPDFRATFFLPGNLGKDSPVSLTIRERKPVHYYWLDKVQPPGGWRIGSTNRFEWSTATVVRYLDGLSLTHLAAAARIGRDAPGKVERVAPVALYHTKQPETVEGYRFVFLPDRKMRLTFQVFRAGETTSLATVPAPSVPADLPKEVRFAAKGWQEGWYQVAVSGYAEDGAVDMMVHFYHRPRLAP